MADQTMLVALAGFTAAGLGLTSAAALRAWSDWLALRRQQLSRGPAATRSSGSEVAQLRERVRRLEAIASGDC